MQPDLAPSQAPPAPGPAIISATDLQGLQQLASRYWFIADGLEPLPIGDLFAADAVLELGSLRLEGVEAIERFFSNRQVAQDETKRTTRHLASHFLITPIDQDRVRVRSTVVVYAGSGERPLPSTAPSGIADFDDLCVRRDGQRWVYSSRTARTVFIGPAAAKFA